MAVLRSKALLPALVLALAACLFAARAFVPAPAPQQSLLRGGAAAAALAASPLAAVAKEAAKKAAKPDELIDYNFAGEFTPFMIIGYFVLTTALTGFAFVSYLVLTKLKII